LIKRKPGFNGKMFWSLEIPFKTGFTVFKTMNTTDTICGENLLGFKYIYKPSGSQQHGSATHQE